MTRAKLQELLDRLEHTAGSSEYSGEMRQQARDEAVLIRMRLEQGDFQVGDRILLRVENEEALSDTFTVQAGRVLALPDVGDVPMAGVLRSEIEPHLTEYLSRFLRDPRVKARALLRLSVTGAVDKPGFYTVNSEANVSDVLMVAGGLGGGAKLNKIRIERGDKKIWKDDALQQAIIDGKTLDELNLQAGDRVVVPGTQQAAEGGFSGSVRTITLLIALPVAIVSLIAIIRR